MEQAESKTPVYDKLKVMQRKFVDAYIGDANGNATKAAKIAGYSEKTSYSIGWENLRKPEIQEAIKERYKDATMGADEVLSRLSGAARSTLADGLELKTYTHSEFVTGTIWDDEDETEEEVEVEHIYTTNRLMLTLEKMVETGLIHFVKAMKETRWGTSYELDDRQGALDKIARALGLYASEGQGAEVVLKVIHGVDVERV